MEQRDIPSLDGHNKEEYPPMHTAEHLVNGTVARMLGCGRAFSTHIEKKKSKCDFRFGRNLTEQERAEVERTVNECIASGAAVRAETMGVEKAAARYDLSRVPEGASQVRMSARSTVVPASGRTWPIRARYRPCASCRATGRTAC